MSSLASKIESILFAAGRPVKISELVRVLNTDKLAVVQALEELKALRAGGGIAIVEKDGRWQMATAPDNARDVGNFINAELREKLTDAAIETLAIILYKQPITRAEIESVRGVNSQYILRQLSIRGMIEKATSPDDARRLIYTTTLDFMTSMGIKDMKDLPAFEELTKSVALPEPPPQNPATAASKPPEQDSRA